MSRETVGKETRSGDLTVEGTVAADSATVSGNVGIGTSSPSAALHVKSAWVTNEGQIQADVPSGGTYSGVTFQNDGTLKGLAVWDNASSRMFLSVPGTTGSVALGYNSVSPALTMDAATRNVGIGTSSPGAALEVAASSPIIRLRDSDIGSTIYSHLSGSGANGSLTLASDVNNATANSAISMQVDGSEKMRVDGDGLITGSGTSLGAWTAYTPTLGGTGWAIGDGTAQGAYVQIGKLVVFKVRITFGSASTYGTTYPQVGLPVTAGGALRVPAMNANCRDISASSNYQLAVLWSSTTAVLPSVLGTNGQLSAVTSSAPFAWAAGDFIDVQGTYEAA